MLADLHLHSRFSDGSMTPRELVSAAVSRGLDAISIVDHDTTAGTEQALRAGARVRLTVIPGIEISAFDYGRNRKVHILGYNYRLPASHIEALCGPIREARHENTLRQIDEICDAGYPISRDQVMAHATGERDQNGSEVMPAPYCLYKQHIMLALIEAGCTDHIYSPLYMKLFKNGGAADHDIEYLDALDAVRAIHDDGGYAVLAHPPQLDSFDYIPELLRAGLDGLEVYHECHDPRSRARTAGEADKHKLIGTGGTDFHGSNGSQLYLGDICAPASAVHQLTRPRDDTVAWTMELVRSAGALARDAAIRPVAAKLKDGNIRDLVTAIDLAVERFLVNRIRERYPHDGFVTEEQEYAEPGGTRWVIDPIDGTTNFVTSRSTFAVCVTRMSGAETRLGLVYNVMDDELFHAAAGEGAYRNGVHLPRTSDRDKPLHECVIECSLSAAWDLQSMDGVNADLLARRTRAQRACGSAALAICEVALGTRDAYISANLHLWDYAAAALILTESGGAYATGEMGDGRTLFVGTGHPLTLGTIIDSVFPSYSFSFRSTPDR